MYGAAPRRYCCDMRIAWLLLVVWPAVAADWLQEIKERGAALEAELQWEHAGDLYRSALARMGPGGSQPDRFWLLTALAEVSFERHEYGESRRWLREAEDSLRGMSEGAPQRARLLSARGTLYLVEGNLTAAEQDLSRAVAISESVATPPDLAAVLHNLAAVEMQMGQLNEAIIHETRALANWQRQLGDRHYYVLKAWISLSSLQGLCGRWAAAESSVKQALAIAETPEALANYAVILQKLKRGREAREIRRRLNLQMFAPPASPLVDVKAIRSEAGLPRVRAR